MPRCSLTFTYTPLVWLPIGATVMAVLLYIYSRRFVGLPETRYFQMLVILSAAWSLLQVVDVLATGLDEKLLLLKLKLVVAPFVTVAVFALLTGLSGRDSWLTRRNLALLSVVPVITVFMAFTTEFHQFFLYDFSVSSGSPAILRSTAGPWSWTYLAYSYGIMITAMVLLIDSTRGANQLYKRQAVVLLCAFLPPVLFTILDSNGLLPVGGMDLAPAAFALSGAIIAWGLYRYRILDVRPIARGEVVENMTDILLVIDLDGRLIDYNRATGSFLDGPSENVMGRQIPDIFPFGGDLSTLLEAQSPRGEVSIGKGADCRTFEASIMPVTVKGELRARMVLLRDITERKQMEEALHAANARLGLLSSLTRHDLLNKLTVIDGYVALARRESDLERAQAFLIKLGSASDAARSLISFTKDYEDVGIRAPSWQGVDDLFARAAGQLVLDKLRVSASTGGLSIYADAMIGKVFYNLLDNSVRHGGEATAASLTCQERDDRLVLTYQDDGTGIAEKDRPHLFERGFGKNTGLGLFLTKEVLAITGIGIAETGEPGKGARFELTVPRGAYRFEP
jgi:PAS domain S-box-containing protein